MMIIIVNECNAAGMMLFHAYYIATQCELDDEV